MTVIKKLILFVGQTENDNVNRMLFGLQRGFEQLGVATSKIYTTAADYREKLIQTIDKDDPSFFLAMTGIGLDLREERNLFNQLGKPFVSVYLDPIILYAEQIRTPIAKRLITSTSDCDIGYWSNIAPDLDIKFLPHASELLKQKRKTDRHIDIVFPATGCESPEDIRKIEWSLHGPKVEAALNNIVDEHLRRPLEPLTNSIETVIGEDIDIADYFAIYPYFASVDRYLRCRERWWMLSELMGLPVTVVGAGWENFQKQVPDSGFRFLGPRIAYDVQDIIQQSKIVLNTCTGYHGSHERIFDSLAGGAIPVTRETHWLKSAVPNDTILFFNQETDDSADFIKNLLENSKKMSLMAEIGRAWLKKHHTWRHRADAILNLI